MMRARLFSIKEVSRLLNLGEWHGCSYARVLAALPFSRDLTIPHLDLSHIALCIMGN